MPPRRIQGKTAPASAAPAAPAAAMGARAGKKRKQPETEEDLEALHKEAKETMLHLTQGDKNCTYAALSEARKRGQMSIVEAYNALAPDAKNEFHAKYKICKSFAFVTLTETLTAARRTSAEARKRPLTQYQIAKEENLPVGDPLLAELLRSFKSELHPNPEWAAKGERIYDYVTREERQLHTLEKSTAVTRQKDLGAKAGDLMMEAFALEPQAALEDAAIKEEPAVKELKTLISKTRSAKEALSITNKLSGQYQLQATATLARLETLGASKPWCESMAKHLATLSSQFTADARECGSKLATLAAESAYGPSDSGLAFARQATAAACELQTQFAGICAAFGTVLSEASAMCK